jgi:hypothetical protein
MDGSRWHRNQRRPAQRRGRSRRRRAGWMDIGPVGCSDRQHRGSQSPADLTIFPLDVSVCKCLLRSVFGSGRSGYGPVEVPFSTVKNVNKRLLAGIFLGSALAAVALPARAAVDNGLPIRWNTGGAVWSTNESAMQTFLESGEVTDRGLESGLNSSGWTADEVREGLNKTYNVDMVGVSRFLYSADGVKFLKNQTTSYFPYWSKTEYSVQALRSAIIADARDGQISSAGIMANLPVDMRLADFCNTYTGAQNVCAEGRCQGDAQCTSLLSWYVFLPACIQANQQSDPVAQVRVNTSAPAPAAEPAVIRGLW